MNPDDLINFDDLMGLDELRTTFTGYRPGHTEPVDLCFVMGHEPGTGLVRESNLLRIHGTGLQALALLAALARDEVDLSLIEATLCSETVDGQDPCTHSYWRVPVSVLPDVVLAAWLTLPGGDTMPYAARPDLAGD
jgi:hypothetical protein